MHRTETLELGSIDKRYEAMRLARPELVAQIQRSVERHGLLTPVVVNAGADGERVLLDGFKRVEALRRLGRDEVLARVVEFEEAAARAALITYNVHHRGLCDLEEAWVVRSLVRQCKLKQVAVAELLGRHKSWVCRRLQLAERLTRELQDDMRLGLVAASTARELARLPAGNQGAVAEAVRQHGLTSHQAAGLVDKVLRAPDAKAVEPLLADPLRFVGPRPSEPPAPKDPRLTARAEKVRQSLLRLSHAAVGAAHDLGRHPPLSFGDLDAQILAELAGPVVARGEEALTLCRALVREPPG